MNRSQIIDKYIELYRNLSSIENYGDYKLLIKLALENCLSLFDNLYNNLQYNMDTIWFYLNNNHSYIVKEKLKYRTDYKRTF